jgi:hypothetical protein
VEQRKKKKQSIWINKYSFIFSIRECAADLIRDISDVAFDELVKYKIYEKNTLIKPTRYLFDDGENDNKYHIELSESENRPLTLYVDICILWIYKIWFFILNRIGSDEEDNDSDQEENKDTELETAVSRQEINHHQNENAISTEFNSNGHEYILVNRSNEKWRREWKFQKCTFCILNYLFYFSYCLCTCEYYSNSSFHFLTVVCFFCIVFLLEKKKKPTILCLLAIHIPFFIIMLIRLTLLFALYNKYCHFAQ